MEEPVVCLGCGLEVGRVGGCVCAAPPVHAALPSNPYRASVDGTACPRCEGRLIEETLHDVVVLDCGACRGFFLDRPTIEKLVAPDGHALRLAFPKRPQGDAHGVVRYLHCPICRTLMNRTVFARVSGVIVDVCKTDGIWFDTGEVNAIIDFVEAGGMERARAKEKARHAEENAELRAEFARQHQAAVAAIGYRPAPVVGGAEDTLAFALLELFR